MSRRAADLAPTVGGYRLQAIGDPPAWSAALVRFGHRRREAPAALVGLGFQGTGRATQNGRWGWPDASGADVTYPIEGEPIVASRLPTAFSIASAVRGVRLDFGSKVAVAGAGFAAELAAAVVLDAGMRVSRHETLDPATFGQALPDAVVDVDGDATTLAAAMTCCRTGGTVLAVCGEEGPLDWYGDLHRRALLLRRCGASPSMVPGDEAILESGGPRLLAIASAIAPAPDEVAPLFDQEERLVGRLWRESSGSWGQAVLEGS